MTLRVKFSEELRSKFLKEYHTGSPRFHAGFGEEFHVRLRELIVIVNRIKINIQKHGKGHPTKLALR